MTNYIALAVPFFFILIGIELWFARRKGQRVYRLTDTLIDLSSGTLMQVMQIFAAAGLLAVYAALYQHRFVSFELSNPVPWLLAFFGYDLSYYVWHRLSHRVNLLWASHVTHHSSEEYNLSVALRQSVTSSFTSLPFSIWLALCGVPVVVYATIASFSLLYQFWIHTDLIGKLGWFEKLFNTPSQHRVHHAINPRYLDKNYAATLCIWDRMFGSFEEETEEPVYGLVKPLGSFQPLWVQFHRYWEVLVLSVRAPALVDKVKVWFKGPEWSVPGLPPLPHAPEVTRATRAKYDPQTTAPLRRYLFLQLAVTMTGAFFLILLQNKLPMDIVIGGSVLVVMTTVSWGALIERRSWAMGFELVRLALLAGGGLWMVHGTVFALFPLVLAIGMGALLMTTREPMVTEAV
ncbi:MAG: sterol desaturase family protein [Deltaproteobacteria bacterium]|nr:sterol desaturase family protein [Deltaproteobacteria bacterium]